MIEAAGGVIWRHNEVLQTEILLIHRPHRRDWSLPKGKLLVGEIALRAALREVREETGLHCEVGPELPGARYLDRKRRDKHVRYWAMRPISGRFRRNAEVDETRWTTLEAAAATLTNDHDIPVIMALHDILSTVHSSAHSSAGHAARARARRDQVAAVRRGTTTTVPSGSWCTVTLTP